MHLYDQRAASCKLEVMLRYKFSPRNKSIDIFPIFVESFVKMLLFCIIVEVTQLHTVSTMERSQLYI